MTAEQPKATAENLFVGSGELGTLLRTSLEDALRSHNWSQTPLGAVETWSDDLKRVVQILLTELERVKLPTDPQQDAQQRPDNLAIFHQVNQLNAFRGQLAEALRLLTDASEIQAIAAQTLGKSLGVTRVIYIEVVADGEEVIVHCNYTNGVAPLHGRYRLEDYRRNVTIDHQAGRTQVVTDIPNHPKYTDIEKTRYREIDIAAHIDVPLIKNNQFVALLAVHQSTPRQWTETEIKLVEETAEQTWAAVERAYAEAALRESEAKYRTLFESIDEGFCIAEILFDENDTPVDYRFLEINSIFEQQTGLQQAVGRTARQLVPDLEDFWIEIYGKVALTGEPVRFENRSGSMNRWFNVYACRTGQPEDRKVAIVFNDITERKQVLEREQTAREAAERANRIKDEFLAVLSHELRSPLNPILGWTQLLQSGKLDESRRTEALKTIERNAKLQAQLIEDLLDISRIIRGKLSLAVVPVSLTFVISAAVETVRLAAEAKHIKLQLDLDKTVAPIYGDAARLQQVVWNLLSNAVKFTPTGGQVTVELRQLNQLAQIRVIDTGKGINPQFLPYMFEYFRQEDNSTTRKFGGLGLGLAIARQIVELHGGTVEAESQGDGQGATFIVQLPTIQQTALIGSEPVPTPINAEQPLENIQVLLVDDEPDTREFVAFLLEQRGAKVTAVASGLEALQASEQSIPDVLVSDIGMPQMDGYMLIQQFRSRPQQQNRMIPAIALTAYATEMDQHRALQAGFQTHITKPVESEVLVRAIALLLGRT